MLPSKSEFNGFDFELASAATGTQNAVVPKGQTLHLPEGHFNRVYILAASTSGDQHATFRAGQKAADLVIQDWGGFIGQWDTLLWKPEAPQNWNISAHPGPGPPADFDARESRPASP